MGDDNYLTNLTSDELDDDALSDGGEDDLTPEQHGKSQGYICETPVLIPDYSTIERRLRARQGCNRVSS
jgi:hypothetical protein